MPAIRAANLALKFVLELAALAALAYGGANAGAGPAASILLAIALPALMIVLWARFAAPRSQTRLHTRARMPFELGVFAVAALVLAAGGRPVAAGAFAALAVVNAVLLTAFGQLEA